MSQRILLKHSTSFDYKTQEDDDDDDNKPKKFISVRNPKKFNKNRAPSFLMEPEIYS